MDTLPSEAKIEVATIATDPHRWWYGPRIENEDTVLATRGAGKGLWLYDELMRDPKVGAAIDKRRLALVGREWEIEPADDSPAAQAAADFVRTALDGVRLNQVVGGLLEAVLKGIAVAEVIWRGTDAGVVPDRIVARDPRRFTFHQVEGQPPQLRLLTRAAPLDGVPVPPWKFIVHRHGERYDSPWGLGLGQRLFWPVFFKRQGIGFWLSAIEKFAAPTPLGKYPPGTSEADIKKLLDAMTAISREAAVVIPEGMLVELVEAKRAGAFDSYEQMARYMDEDIAITVLGETLTTSAGASGSRALGEVHNEVRLELVAADADSLSDTLNATLLRWIAEINMPGAPPPRIWWDVEPGEDLNARAKRDVDVKSLGFRPTLDYITTTYGEGWEEAPEPPPPAMPPPNQPQPGAPGQRRNAIAELFAERGRPPRPRDAADDLAEQLNGLVATAQDAMIDKLRDVVMGAESLAALRDALVEAFPALDDADLARLMGDALVVAALAGRSDLADGAA
jgi:phage gp29-like protein